MFLRGWTQVINILLRDVFTIDLFRKCFFFSESHGNKGEIFFPLLLFFLFFLFIDLFSYIFVYVYFVFVCYSVSYLFTVFIYIFMDLFIAPAIMDFLVIMRPCG